MTLPIWWIKTVTIWWSCPPLNDWMLPKAIEFTFVPGYIVPYLVDSCFYKAWFIEMLTRVPVFLVLSGVITVMVWHTSLGKTIKYFSITYERLFTYYLLQWIEHLKSILYIFTESHRKRHECILLSFKLGNLKVGIRIYKDIKNCSHNEYVSITSEWLLWVFYSVCSLILHPECGLRRIRCWFCLGSGLVL